MQEFLAILEGIFLSPLSVGEFEFPISLLRLLLELVLPVILIIVLYRLLVMAFGKLIRRSSWKEETGRRVSRWLRIVLRIFALLAIGSLVLRLLGAEIAKYGRFVITIINAPLMESGGTTVSVMTLLLLIPVFYLAGKAGQVTRNFSDQYFFNRVGLDESKKFSISNLLRYTVMILAAMIGLSVIGIDLSVLTVLFGVLGIGLGFGLQSVVANIFAGIIIIFTRPVKEGDRILVDQYEGTVISIRFLSTVINTISYETIIVPNRQLIDSTVYNYSYDDRRIILRNPVQVSYDTDLDRAIEIMSAVGLRNPYGLKVPEPDVRVSSFDDSGITLLLLTWIVDVSHKYSALSWNNLEIWRSFRDEGIEIPYPQRDLHLRSGLDPLVREIRELRKKIPEKS
jgi:potassium-dependent mechanosensitive channel